MNGRGLEPHDYALMLRWATPPQQEAVEGLIKHGSGRKAATALGIHPRKLEERLQRLRENAARAGHSPEDDAEGLAPDGYSVKGKSTYYDRDGKVRGQWVKTQVDKTEARLEALKAAVSEFAESVPKQKRVAKPRRTAEKLLAVVPMGDPHIGMRAWRQETGEDFDLKIARQQMDAAVERLVNSTPPCGYGALINLGDFFHADDDTATTKRSGHHLDVDGRHAKVLRVGVAAMKSAVEHMLRRHSHVRVINCIGNHDDHSSDFLSLILAEAYAREPRVTVDTVPAPFRYVRHGKVLIGATHGHTVKADALPGVMATDRASDWGETLFRHWYVGHVHHKSTQDYPGVTVEYCRTLAAKDNWTHAAGYRAHRDIRSIVYDSDFGEVETHRVGIESVR